MTRPQISPQKAAPTFNNGRSATVTRNASNAPREKRLPKAVTKAACNTRNIAMPARAAISDFGALRSSRVKVGASNPNRIARMPTMIPAMYWRLRSPLPTRMAFVGPVRHVLMPPTRALMAEPMPHATAGSG